MMKDGNTACCICGRPLKNPISVERGIGPECAAKYSLFNFNKSRKAEMGQPFSRTPQYSYHFVKIEGQNVAVVIDKSDGTACPSVTNAIEMVSEDLGVDKIVYRDTDGDWDFWSTNDGFRPLGEKGHTTKDMDRALELTAERYLAKNLFNTKTAGETDENVS